MDKFSYALGMSLAQNLLRSGVDSLEFEDLLDGMKAIYSREEHKVSDIEANNILQTYFEKKEKEMEIKRTLESEMSKKLCAEDEWVDFDENALLRTDKASLSNYVTSLVRNGIMTLNEGRAEVGLSPIDGGDKLVLPFSNAEASTIAEKDVTE